VPQRRLPLDDQHGVDGRKRAWCEWALIPTFSFPVKAGPHLPTPEGWKAELAM